MARTLTNCVSTSSRSCPLRARASWAVNKPYFTPTSNRWPFWIMARYCSRWASKASAAERLYASVGRLRQHVGENFEDRRREHVHPVKAKILATAQTGNDQALFSLGRRWLLQDGIDAIKPRFARDRLAANSTVKRKKIFSRYLHR